VTPPHDETDVTTAILALYQGPYEEFISRRDALAKQLRAEKRRDDAASVKALRKPSRMAWVLDRIVGDEPQAVGRLDAAIAAAQTATDLRTALETVKEAVRSVAAVGARIAVRDGHPIDPNAIASAIQAIIGNANAFAEFRAARLVEVPEAGGLDMLITLSPQPSPTVAKAPPPESPRVIEPSKEDPRAALAASARAELRRAEQSLDAARAQFEKAATAIRDTDAKLAVAEQALLRAQSELDARRAEAEGARRLAESAAADRDDAQRAVDEARARVAELE
jgi:exonuclease VII small subunit